MRSAVARCLVVLLALLGHGGGYLQAMITTPAHAPTISISGDASQVIIHVSDPSSPINYDQFQVTLQRPSGSQDVTSDFSPTIQNPNYGTFVGALALEGGQNTLYVTVCNTDGGCNLQQQIYNVSVQPTATVTPANGSMSVSPNAPASAGFTVQSIAPSGSGAMAHSVYAQCDWAGGASGCQTSAGSISLTPGQTTTITVAFTAGNPGSTGTVVLTVTDANGIAVSGETSVMVGSAPNVAPQLSVSPSSGTVTTPLQVAINVTDASGIDLNSVEVVLQNASGTQTVAATPLWGGSTDYNFQADLHLAPGTNTVQVTACDLAGLCAGVTRSYTLDAPAPTVATVTIVPATSTIASGATVQLTATARDANGTVVPGATVTWSTSSAAIAALSATSGSSVMVTGGGPGTATITAASGSASGSATVTVTGGTGGTGPIISLTSHADSLLQPELCVADCFDAVTSYTTPAYFFRDVPRTLTLVYRSQHAAPKGYVRFDFRDSAATAADRYSIRLRRSDGSHVTFLNGNSSELFVGDSARPVDARYRVALAFDASALPTGVSSYTLVVAAIRGATHQTTAIPVSVLIVNERASPFGAGWSVAELQRIHKLADGGRLIVEGTGRAIRFGRPSCAGCAFRSPAGEFSTLTGESSGVVTRTYPDRSTAVFNTAGNMIRFADPRDNRTLFIWNGAMLVGVRDPAARQFTLDYDAAQKLVTITDPANRQSVVTIDASNRLTAVRNPAQFTAHYSYNADLTLREITDERGGLWTYAYDAIGRLATATAPQISADGVLRRPVLSYRSPELAEGEVPAGAGTAQNPLVRRDPATVRAELVNAAGHTTRYTVDRFRAPLRIEAPLNRLSVLERNAAGQIVLATDPAGDSVRFVWSGPRLQQQIDRSTEKTVNYRYDTTYNVVTAVFGDVVPQWVAYTSGVRTQQWVGDSIGQGQRFYPRADGRDTLVLDPQGHGTRLRYLTGASQNLEWTISGRDTTWFWYDAAGRPDSVRNGRRLTTQFSYDALNRVQRVMGPIQDATTYTYDALFLTEVRDAIGQTYGYQPNALGWVERETDPRGQAIQSVFDVNGNVRRLTNRRGQPVDFTYNAADELETRVADGTTARYRVNPATRTVSDSNATTRTETRWDPATRSLVHRVWMLGREHVITDQYDVRELRTARAVQQVGSSTVYQTRYHYGARGLLDSLTDLSGRVTRLAYNADRLLTSTVLPINLSVSRAVSHVHEPSRVQYSTVAADTELGQAVSYGRLGLVEEVLRSDLQRGTEYRYDSGLRLTSARGFEIPSSQVCTPTYMGKLQPDDPAEPPDAYNCEPGDKTYTGVNRAWSYDKVGNDLANATLLATGNRATTRAGYVIDYDADGNLLSKGGHPARMTQTFTWDVLGQLTRITEGTTVADMSYDAAGRRVRRSSGGVVSGALYAGDDLVATVDGNGEITAVIAHYPGVDQPHSLYRANESYYYARDHHGSVTGLFSDAGILVNRYEYGPYGERLLADTVVANPLQYTARERESVGGLVYLRARWYDPELERFLSEDPIGLAGGINLYSYAGGDPINRSDPFGLQAQCPVSALKACGIEDVTVNGRPWDVTRGATSNFGDPTKRGGSVPGIGGTGSTVVFGPTQSGRGNRTLPTDACAAAKTNLVVTAVGDLALGAGGVGIAARWLSAGFKYRRAAKQIAGTARYARTNRYATQMARSAAAFSIARNEGAVLGAGYYSQQGLTMTAMQSPDISWRDFIPGLATQRAAEQAASAC